MKKRKVEEMNCFLSISFSIHSIITLQRMHWYIDIPLWKHKGSKLLREISWLSFLILDDVRKRVPKSSYSRISLGWNITWVGRIKSYQQRTQFYLLVPLSCLLQMLQTSRHLETPITKLQECLQNFLELFSIARKSMLHWICFQNIFPLYKNVTVSASVCNGEEPWESVNLVQILQQCLDC